MSMEHKAYIFDYDNFNNIFLGESIRYGNSYFDPGKVLIFNRHEQ